MSENEIHALFEKFAEVHISERGVIRAEILALTKKLDSPDLLVSYLHSDNYLVRECAAHGVGLFNDERCVQPLTNLLAKEDNKQVQMAIIYSLREMRVFSALESLIKIAKNADYSNLVRSLAMQSIAISTLHNIINPMFEVLEEAALASDRATVEIVESVFDAFEILEDDKNAIPKHLIELLRSAKTPDCILLQTILYLGKRRYTESVEDIASFLDSDDSDLRDSAVKSLGNLGILKVIPKLELMLQDSDENVRSSAKEALQRLQNS